MKCTKCKSNKDDKLFKTIKKSICFDCEIKSFERKIAKYSGFNMGVNSLNRELENIMIITHYATNVFKLPRRKVLGLLLIGKAQVYRPDMVYLLEPNEKDDGFISKILERDNYICHFCGNSGITAKYINGKLITICENCVN